MKNRLWISGKSEGIYHLRAEGERVKLKELDIKYLGREGQWDLYQAAGIENDRYLAIHQDELSWLYEGGKESEIKNFRFFTKKYEVKI